MGLLSWIFPSDEDRIARATSYLEREKYADARMEVMGIDHPEAHRVLRQAEEQLSLKNLETAVSWCQAGDNMRARHHLEMAQNFHGGGLEDQFKEARRQMREIREQLRLEEEQKRAERDARIAAMEDSPFHAKDEAHTIFDDLSGTLEDPELEGSIALLIDGYPAPLRDHVDSTLVKAVLDLLDGRPDLALPTLLGLADTNPLVCYERARAAKMLGDTNTALTSMRAFHRLTGAHFTIGNQNTGIFLAQLLIEAGKQREAMELITDARRDEPDFAGPIYAQLLSFQGNFEKAEHVLLPLIQKYPKDAALYGLLARNRLAAGRDLDAMRALEASLEATYCAPGQCGYRPPNLGIIRSLATLYFEKNIETERAQELAEQAASLVQQPTWDDVYLAGLAGRQRRDTRVEPSIEALWSQTQAGPRFERLEKHLPLAAN